MLVIAIRYLFYVSDEAVTPLFWVTLVGTLMHWARQSGKYTQAILQLLVISFPDRLPVFTELF